MVLPKYSGTPQLILKEIFLKKHLTRMELATLLEVSNLTVSKAVTALLADNIIIEKDILESSGGRKPVALSINPNYAYIIGIDIGCYSFKIGAVALDGTILDQEKIVTYFGTVPAKTLSEDEIVAKIEAITQQHGMDRLAGICLSISGLVDYESRSPLFCPNISGLSSDLAKTLEQHFGVCVHLDTSARGMALAEKLFGLGRQAENFLFVPVGFSISGGLILNGQLYRGANGFAGELGHFHVSDEEEQEPCTCGNSGCLELFTTLPMLVIETQKRLYGNIYSPLLQAGKNIDTLTISDVAEGYAMGDKTVISVVRSASEKFGLALSSVIDLLNPELIVFGGGLTETFPDMVDEIARSTKELSLTPSVSKIRFEKTELGADISVIGSASHLLDEYFC